MTEFHGGSQRFSWITRRMGSPAAWPMSRRCSTRRTQTSRLWTKLGGYRMSDQGDVFSRLPPEVIQHIAVAACELTPTGPPTQSGISRAYFLRQVRLASPHSTRRWIALKRICSVSNAGTLLVCSEEHLVEDMWMIYLMFLESDGRNYAQLLWARVSRYLRTVFREKLLPSPKPGYMLESTTRALGFWMMWYLTEVYTVIAETPNEAAQMRAMLRPWALASHKYDILCAPYTHWTLPAPDVPDLGEEPAIATPQNLADLDLRNRTEIVTHMGRRIQLAPPRASLAAIMALMVRLERNGPIPAHPAPPIPNIEQLPPTIQPGHPGLTIYPRTRYPAFYGPGSTEFDGRINRTGSAAYDTEWRRILQCGNPSATPKFKAMSILRPGELAGQWEGRLVFLTFDAFRDMLAGVPGAVTNGPIAQQPNAWRIWEHHLVSRRRRIPLNCEPDPVIGEKLPIGNVLNAYIPKDAQFIQHDQHQEFGTRRLEVRIPDETCSLGYKSYNYITLDGPTDPPPTQIPRTSVMALDPSIDMDLSADWEQPQPPRFGDGDYEFEEEIVDTLITGEGRSSRGSFKLTGRIRAWDGMIILVMDYDAPTSNGNGRWLYKGYVVSGGNWIGRWRDTFTPERLCGYEGVFSVTRQY
ncbi:hypothetical protein OPQ81_007359 [Rhizoctonia solani]|nr:hypothetical protein OPQ81_007359 [Rhizoctonia solani]